MIDPNLMSYACSWLSLPPRYETSAINRTMRLLRALERMLKTERELDCLDFQRGNADGIFPV
jgi:hypothetical protein